MVEIVNEQWKAEVSDLLQQETDRLKALARAEVDDFWVTHYKV
ncbi:conjugative transfer protein MobI(A/C), partial [Escherichia coli]